MNNLKYKNYLGSIEYDQESNILYGKVLGLNRVLISYEGENIAEMKKDFENGIDHYIASCEERGEKPQKSFSGVFNVRVPSEIHVKAVEEANKQGVTLNMFVKSAIEQSLSHK